MPNPKHSALILVPLKMELKYLREYMGAELKSENTHLGLIHIWNNFSIALCGHGKAQAAAQASFWIGQTRPELVLCCGAAGALDSRLSIGDIVAGESTLEYDYIERFSDQSSPPIFSGEKKLLERLKCKKGIILSGDQDVVAKSQAEELRKKYAAACVAWEGAGVARAALLHKIPFLEIRAITDTADHTASDQFKVNLPIAMKNLAAELQSLL